MNVMDVLRADLKRAKGYWTKMAQQTGIEHSTISRIYRGETPNPQIETYQKIRNWLDANLPLIEQLTVDPSPTEPWPGRERRQIA